MDSKLSLLLGSEMEAIEIKALESAGHSPFHTFTF